MAYLTLFSIQALLNPMINKMADEASALLYLICWHEVWVKVTYDWSTALCYVDPVFTCQSYKHKHKHKRKLVCFSCAYAYAYVDPVFSCLHMCLTLSLCASKNQAGLRVFSKAWIVLSLFFTRAQMSRVVYKASCWDLQDFYIGICPRGGGGGRYCQIFAI